MRIRPPAVLTIAALIVAGSVFYAWQANSARSGASHSLPGLPLTPLVNRGELQQFVGAAACAGCHRKESQTHALTSHAQTLQRVTGSPLLAAFRSSQRLRDSARSATYSFRVVGDTGEFVVQQEGRPEPIHMPAAYALGSGRIGTTFLVEQAPGIFAEGHTSHYRDGKWHWTPGQQRADPTRPLVGKPLADRTATACFLCHSTALLREDGRLLPAESIPNVGCERCHGPGRAHVEAISRHTRPQPIYGLRRLSADKVQKLCENCHGAPGAVDDAQLRENPSLPRFAGPGLALSRCYREGGGKLSCVSCHNPHERPSKDLSSYEPVCKSCHGTSKSAGAVCPINPRNDCIRCHMPALPVEFPVPAEFRTHWIRSYGLR